MTRSTTSHLSAERSAKVASNLRAITDKYRDDLEQRSAARRESEPVKATKLAVLDALIDFDPSTPIDAEAIQQRIDLIDAILEDQAAESIIEKLNTIKNDSAATADSAKFNRHGTLMWLIDLLLQLFRSEPHAHFHDTLAAARTALVKAKAELSTTYYSATDIQVASHLAPSQFAEDDHATVLQDLQREVKLGDRTTRGQTPSAIEAEIRAFTEGHPEIADFIGKTPAQAMAAPLEKELISSYARPAGFGTLTKTTNMRWVRDGNRFFCEVEVSVVSVGRMKDSAQMAFPSESTEAQPHLMALDQAGEAAMARRIAGKEAIDPVLTATMRVELVVDPRTRAVIPKVERLEVTPYVAELRRTSTRTYSEEQLSAMDLSATSSAATKTPAEGRSITGEVLADFDRGTILIIEHKGEVIRIPIPSSGGDVEDHEQRLLKGIGILTGEGSRERLPDTTTGFSKIISTTTPQALLSPLSKEIASNIAIPIPPGGSISTVPDDMQWRMERGELYFEGTLKLVGISDPANEVGIIVDPKTGSLTTIPDTAYNGHIDEHSEDMPPIAEARICMKFSRNPDGTVNPVPIVTALSVTSRYPETYGLTAPDPVATKRAGGPPWTHEAGHGHHPSAAPAVEDDDAFSDNGDDPDDDDSHPLATH